MSRLSSPPARSDELRTEGWGSEIGATEMLVFDLTAAQEQVFWPAFAAVVALTIAFRMLGERTK